MLCQRTRGWRTLFCTIVSSRPGNPRRENWNRLSLSNYYCALFMVSHPPAQNAPQRKAVNRPHFEGPSPKLQPRTRLEPDICFWSPILVRKQKLPSELRYAQAQLWGPKSAACGCGCRFITPKIAITLTQNTGIIWHNLACWSTIMLQNMFLKKKRNDLE